MTANLTQVDYQQLKTITRQFETEKEEIGAMHGRLQRQVENLYAQSWKGTGADNFHNEMVQAVLPGMRRLHAALGAAAEQLNVIARLYLEAEQEASNLFKQGGDVHSANGLPEIPQTSVGKMLLHSLEDIRAIVKPFNLDEGLSYIKDTDAGKDLVKQAEQAHVLFIFPDGTQMGDPNGHKVIVDFGNTDTDINGFYSPDPDKNPLTEDQKIIISDTWWKRFGQGKGSLADVLSHEMQHAIDDRNGLMTVQSPDTNDPRSIERAYSDYLTKTVASEVRAFDRGYAVEFDRPYQDDGVTTHAEADRILKKGYEKIYEDWLNSGDLGKKYTFDVWLSDSGQVQVTTQPKPNLTPLEF